MSSKRHDAIGKLSDAWNSGSDSRLNASFVALSGADHNVVLSQASYDASVFQSGMLHVMLK